MIKRTYHLLVALILVLCTAFSATAQVVQRCVGDTLWATANNEFEGSSNYWYKDGVLYDTAATIAIYEPGIYEVMSQTGAGCVSPYSTPLQIVNVYLASENDTQITLKNVPVNVEVWQNDTIPSCAQADTTTLRVTTLPENGSVTINPDGTIDYTPNLDYIGVDSFFYQFEDEFGNNTGSWVFITIDIPMAVELLSFDAIREGSTSLLTWHTADTENGDQFLIERSADSREFIVLDSVAGMDAVHSYQYIDRTPLQGRNFYRLFIRNADGSTRYSQVRLVIHDAEYAIKIYPNPADQLVHVDLGSQWQDVKNITVTDISGRVMMNQVNIDQQIISFAVDQLPAQTLIFSIYSKTSGVIGHYKVVKK